VAARLWINAAAIRWALSQAVDDRDDRYLLIAYAMHCPRGSNKAWPSNARIEEITMMDERAITRAKKRLMDRALIKDTGERRGGTGRVKVYALSIPTKSQELNPPENGGINGAEIPANAPPNTHESAGLNTHQNGGRNKEVEKISGREEEKPSRFFLSGKWKPDDGDVQWAQQNGLSEYDISIATARFIEYHTMDRRRHAETERDWFGLWRTWILGDLERRAKAESNPMRGAI
jgi:hypothetical protein